MALKTYNPTTPGLRHRVRLTWDTEGGEMKVPKFLSKGKISTGGRNNRGRVTSFHRGGGHKRLLRDVKTPVVMYTQDGLALPYSHGKVLGIQYDPNRTARIALVQPEQPTGLSHSSLSPSSARPHYQIASKNLSVGDRVTWIMGYGSTETTLNELETRSSGSTIFLRDATVGQSLYNIEMSPLSGGKVARSSGTFAVVQHKSDKDAVLRLPSGEVRRFSLNCRATLGAVGGEDHALEVIGNAGSNRHRSKRPSVRGTAKNPVDHPHGGRTNGGRPTMTPWSRVQKGKPTVKTRSVFVVSSRKTKVNLGFSGS